MATSAQERSQKDKVKVKADARKSSSPRRNGSRKRGQQATTNLSSHAPANADVKLKIVKYKRKVKKLEQNLVDIEKEKEDELAKIVEETRRVREETARLAKEQKELGFMQKEIAELRQESDLIVSQNEKLKKNMRNLKINNIRLEKFGNAEYFEKLRLHHDSLVDKKDKLTMREAECEVELEQMQQEVAKKDKSAFMEYRAKHLYRTTSQEMIKKVEESGDPALVMTVLDLFRRLEEHEASSHDPFPFESPNISQFKEAFTSTEENEEEKEETMLDHFKRSKSSRLCSDGLGAKSSGKSKSRKDRESKDKRKKSRRHPSRRSSVGGAPADRKSSGDKKKAKKKKDKSKGSSSGSRPKTPHRRASYHGLTEKEKDQPPQSPRRSHDQDDSSSSDDSL